MTEELVELENLVADLLYLGVAEIIGVKDDGVTLIFGFTPVGDAVYEGLAKGFCLV